MIVGSATVKMLPKRGGILPHHAVEGQLMAGGEKRKRKILFPAFKEQLGQKLNALFQQQTLKTSVSSTH